MANKHGTGVLTDAQWRRLSPLIEAVRPRGKTEHHDLRRTIAAIIWRHRNGATWRSIPAELGPWWMAAQTLPPGPPRGVGAPAGGGAGARRRAGHDVPGWDRHPRAPEGGGYGPKGGTQAERDAREALGRSRGGYGTKACVIADGRGRAVGFALAPGQAHELPLSPGVKIGT